MLGEEKKELNLLLQFRICKIYVETGLSTKFISELVGMPKGSVKRAIKILDEEFDKCVELLPKAQMAALDRGVISNLDLITEVELKILREYIRIEREERKKYAKGRTETLVVDESLKRYIDETAILQEENNARLTKPKRSAEQIYIESLAGKSIGMLADDYGLSKSTIQSILVKKRGYN
jgi:hypothetical protein